MSKKLTLIILLAVGIVTYPRTVLAQFPQDYTPTDVIICIAWSPDGTQIATTNNNGTFQIWAAQSNRLLRELPSTNPDVKLAAVWSPDGKHFAATVNENVLVWDTSTWDDPRILSGHLDPVWDISWNPDNTRLASVSYAGGFYFNFFIWDLTVNHRLRISHYLQKKVTTGAEYSVDWSPDGNFLVTTGGSRARIWDLPSPTSITPLIGQGGEVINARWSPDGTQIASVGFDERVLIWDVATATIAHELLGHAVGIAAFVYGVDWSPDGRFVASAGADGSVRVWEVESEEQVNVILVEGGAYSVAFSPDGTKLAYGGANGAFQIVSLAQ